MRKYDIEIVSHAYAVTLPVYRTHLKYQLASLFHFTHVDIDVRYSVFTSLDDAKTIEYLHQAKAFMPSNIEINVRVVPNGSLFRRAVGRNIQALAAEARVYWYVDCDYMFGENCLMSLLEQVDETSGLVFPRYVKINPDHTTGDRMCSGITDYDMFPNFDDQLFIPRQQKLAIGGVHIIGVNRLLEVNPKTNEPFGYINGHRKCQPVDEADGFRSCRCDVFFKGQHQPATQINIQNVFRIRHSSAGRVFNLAGERTKPMPESGHD